MQNRCKMDSFFIGPKSLDRLEYLFYPSGLILLFAGKYVCDVERVGFPALLHIRQDFDNLMTGF